MYVACVHSHISILLHTHRFPELRNDVQRVQDVIMEAQCQVRLKINSAVYTAYYYYSEI